MRSTQNKDPNQNKTIPKSQKAGGEYPFIVHEEGTPKISFRAAAEKLGLPDFSGCKSVAWRSVARKFVEVA